MTDEEIGRLVAGLFTVELGSIPLTWDLNLVETGIIDSLALTKLVAALETHIQGLRIPDSDATPENLGSVGLISRYLAGQLG